MKLYWWRRGPSYPLSADAAAHLRGPQVHNFGDEITHLILDKMGLTYVWASPLYAELVITGSVLEHLPRHWAGTVCGAGKLHERSRIHLGSARVFALRGKLTLAGCRGIKGTPVLGDPGLLVPRWFRQPVAQYDLGVLPHWKDWQLRRRYSYGHFIDPLSPPEKVITEVASCRRLITSSLHGAIVADAYGIPRQVEAGHFEESEGGDFKFRDYSSIYDGDTHFGHMWTAPRDQVEKIQNDLYGALQIATGIDLGEPERMHPQISFLVPFRDDGEHRSLVWNCLRQYWCDRFPTVEIVQGWDDHVPFNKSAAVNNAARIARGRIFVILDADAYMYPLDLQTCANQIDHEIHLGKRAWFMPYTLLYRLNQKHTLRLIEQRLEHPLPIPPPLAWQEPKDVNGDPIEFPGGTHYGHQYGAMAQMMPREAFELVGGMDPNFRGWGSEDASFLRSLDTLYCQHQVHDAGILHFWHERPGEGWERQWVGQQWAAANSRLSQRYMRASAEISAMRGLCDEHPFPGFDWD